MNNKAVKINASKKYKLIKKNFIEFDKNIIYEIQALRNFSDVKKGDKGGFISCEDNLSHDDDCWVYDDAVVFGNAKVYENAKIKNTSIIRQSAQIYGNAKILEASIIGGTAQICGNTIISNKQITESSIVDNIEDIYDTDNTSKGLEQEKPIKFDSDKPQLHLIPSTPLIALAKVLEFGAKKYKRDNWRTGMEWSRYISAAMRHLHAFNEGKDLDDESGLSHIDHALCCLTFLSEYFHNQIGTDDRYKKDA